jgi:CRP-like cAMP-binding protein
MNLLPSNDIDKIRSFELFQGFDRTLVEKVLSGATSKQYKHREYMYRAGDSAQSFCVVVDGALKLIRHSPRGEDIIMHFAVQGDVVGALLMNQNDSAVYPISAKSMGPTRVACIPKSTFKQYWQTDVGIQGRLNALLYRRMNNIQDDKTMSTSPLRVRIANLLMRHLDQESDNSNQSMSLILTRQEIADALGVAVESVIRSMKVWQGDGTIYRLAEKGPENINVEKLLKNLEP